MNLLREVADAILVEDGPVKQDVLETIDKWLNPTSEDKAEEPSDS